MHTGEQRDTNDFIQLQVFMESLQGVGLVHKSVLN